MENIKLGEDWEKVLVKIKKKMSTELSLDKNGKEGKNPLLLIIS